VESQEKMREQMKTVNPGLGFGMGGYGSQSLGGAIVFEMAGTDFVRVIPLFIPGDKVAEATGDL